MKKRFNLVCSTGGKMEQDFLQSISASLLPKRLTEGRPQMNMRTEISNH